MNQFSSQQFSTGVQASDFDAISLRLASPEDILSWSHGEVTKPETINYRTQKTEKDGLFCERIFGPTKDWECYCGKYKRIRYKGIICDKCGVEVTRSLVRRERMGHIALASPIAHIWFVRGVPSRIGMVLDIPLQALEKVTYFASFIISRVDEVLKAEAKEQVNHECKAKKKALENSYNQKVNQIKMSGKVEKKDSNEIERLLDVEAKQLEKDLSELDKAVKTAKKELESIAEKAIISEAEYHDLSLKYGHIFEAGIGAEVIRELLERVDIEKEAEAVSAELASAPDGKIKKLTKRLRLFKALKQNGIKPEWMVFTMLPILPPDLRPMVQLDGGRFAASDLNDLYRRVINRNNRLKRLKDLNAPEVIVRNEKRMLQEAVDALIDNNARHGKTVMASTGQSRVLKSIADMLKGKQGRFRQNLLGKRIDYSGRSVIVVGPNLKLHECGLPKVMALELFRPFVISQLIKLEFVHNVRSANRFIESGRPEVWDILESITNDAHVLLNRAPTLHRLGIQAFKPLLIEGKAIHLHPLVCAAFNADFDGDQMAVHVPLTEKARWEAEHIMLSSLNLLKPATGDPITFPSQDMVLGAYYMTAMNNPDGPARAAFSDYHEILLAYERGGIGIQDKILYASFGKIIETTPGRVIFSELLPEELKPVNKKLDRKELRGLVSKSFEICGRERTVVFLDKMMETSFKYLTTSGISWGMDDLPVIADRDELLEIGQKEVDHIIEQYHGGLLSPEEKHAKVIEVWSKVKDKVTAKAKEALLRVGGDQNPVYTMIDSGARGSWGQLIQMLGMKGLVTSPSGETIELPVKGNFKQGFDVLEYFISTHGARKGLSDTALRTANAGYLTRRLIDIAQEMVVTVEDCKDTEGLIMNKAESEQMAKTLQERIKGRFIAEDLKDKKGNVVIKKGTLMEQPQIESFMSLEVESVKIRSVLTCKANYGVCRTCYGWDLGHNKLVELGMAVGIIAAQSIGEPGTQLTMKTFHTGGVAEKDITQGLPRVEEIFEARPIKKGAVLSEIDGKVKVNVKDRDKVITVTSQDGKTTREYAVPYGVSILVSNGDLVNIGDALSEGSIDLHDLHRLKGILAVQKYIIREIQHIYFSQGQDLNDKHIEVICRQMFSRVYVADEGDTEYLPGDVVDKTEMLRKNAALKKEGKQSAVYEQLFLGMTKAALSTSSFLAAASFQETARVLIDAAVTGSTDTLRSLKENVIIGRVIPAGTGFDARKYEV